MANEQELNELAAQLRKPHGEQGIEVASMMNETNQKMTHHAIDLLKIGPDENVLELGHGNCGHLSYLFSQQKDSTYYGLEIAELMTKEAQRINRDFINRGRASFQLYDGVNIPFSTDYFNKIFTVNTIYFWTDPAALFVELYRVTKPNGIVNITFAQRDFMEKLPFTPFGFELYDTNKVISLVEQSAFKVGDVQSLNEQVKSKTGDLVTREFTTVTLHK
ncbi:class I SAM-dependent methyltransferase [Sphingobacterium pedocola]|uniref:Class I SAM-dependent methyltransferase n=1 Tax=Sphingobacterium pedocola TaxID=2082722 RepID=A0ABR9T1I1_9SPHI|nr:class I SAM-dependent methyltransferase [Sphingobacterium pedocola]MBE8719206.1 class I SAM-dependent methyltransferase [Sphingobacterium pedocola]